MHEPEKRKKQNLQKQKQTATKNHQTAKILTTVYGIYENVCPTHVSLRSLHTYVFICIYLNISVCVRAQIWLLSRVYQG